MALIQRFLYLCLSDLTMDNFTSFPSSAIQEISISLNTTLYNVGIAKSPLASFNEFSRNMWTCIDDAILLDDCEIYSYIPDLDANPFSDGLTSCLWSFNYLFWNKKLKRILLFYCRATRYPVVFCSVLV